MFFSSFYNVGYEKLTTIYNHHIENTLNSTSIKCGFDTFFITIFIVDYSKFMVYNFNMCLCKILNY
jgi:hypothetical protein